MSLQLAVAVECGVEMAPYGTVRRLQLFLLLPVAPGEGYLHRQTDATCRSYTRLPTPGAAEAEAGRVIWLAALVETGDLDLC